MVDAELSQNLSSSPKTWFVTGAAGFIGSHLCEQLLKSDQTVIGMDNFFSGSRENLELLQQPLTPQQKDRFRFIESDVAYPENYTGALQETDIVLHNAAIGSVPRSLKKPMETHHANLTGFLTVALTASKCGVPRMVYASSSSVYGDDPSLPKVEQQTGTQLSPYAVSKFGDELYANVFNEHYNIECVGLRYFNVFGPRQDPNGPYAAVIPRWIDTFLTEGQPVIYGDGQTSRDFCYVENVVQANLKAALLPASDNINERIFNVACGEKTTLRELFYLIRDQLASRNPELKTLEPQYEDFRPGDVRHSLADISHAQKFLGYQVDHSVSQGLEWTVDWFARQHKTES